MFQWTITQDPYQGESPNASFIGSTGPENPEDPEGENRQNPPADASRYYFTLHDEEGQRMLNGIAVTDQQPDEEFITSPLIHFAEIAGVASIRWRSHKDWTRHWGHNITPSID